MPYSQPLLLLFLGLQALLVLAELKMQNMCHTCLSELQILGFVELPEVLFLNLGYEGENKSDALAGKFRSWGAWTSCCLLFWQLEAG